MKMNFSLIKMEKIIKYIEKIELYASMLTLVVVVLLIAYSILLRYVFRTPAIWISATITLIFIWTSMLSISYVYKKRGHISITYFIDTFISSKKIKTFIDILIYLVIILIFILAIIGTINIIPLHAERFIIGLRISRVYLSAPILISIISMLITTVYFLLLELKNYN
jgi:TRAP-type C4-dicarboxylate transport system permease small subunit